MNQNHHVVRLFSFMVLAIVAQVASAATERVGGYTWTYSMYRNIGTGDESGAGIYSVSPKPTGGVTIPARLGGKEVHWIEDSVFDGCASLTSVIIPDYVIGIGDYAFANCSALTNVTIPESVNSIGSHAFENCSALTRVTTSSWGSIGDYAFANCTGLTHVAMGEWMSIGEGAFNNCTGLTDVTIPEGCDIGAKAFLSCTGLTYVAMGKGTESIGDRAFANCKGLTSVTIGDDVESIGIRTFRGCSALTSVTIPGSVTRIGSHVFEYCTSLTSVTIPGSVTRIESGAFSGCSGLTSVTMGDGVREVGNSVFENCTSLTSVTIPGSVTRIESGAFSGCSGLTSVTMGDGVREVGNSVFENCTSLTSVTIPESVTSVDKEVFRGCSGLKSVKFDGNAPDDWSDAFYGMSCTIYVHRGSTGWGVDIPGMWKGLRIEYLPSNTVRFNANGGSGATTKFITSGKAIGTLPKATKKGYTLKGWYTKKSGGTKISASTKVTMNVTYYARWTANKYKIKFSKNGGKGSMKTLSVTYGKNVKLTANAFKRTGYKFSGWAKTKKGKVAYKNKAKVKNLTATKGKTVTLYAVWKKAKSFSIKAAATVDVAKSAAAVATAVPSLFAGTFYGDDEGMFTTITVSKTGKVSGKVLFADDKWTIVGKASGQCIDAVITDEAGNCWDVTLAIIRKETGNCRIESADGSIWASLCF